MVSPLDRMDPRSREALYRALVEASPDAALVLREGCDHFVFANPAAERMLGYSRLELQALGPTDLSRPEDLPALADVMTTLREHGHWSGEWPLRRKDGGLVSTEATTGRVVVDDDILSWNLFRDVTERKRLDERVQVDLTRRATLLRVAQRFAVETDASRLLGTLVEEAILLLGASCGTVSRWDQQRRQLILVQTRSLEGPVIGPPARVTGAGMTGRAVESRRTLISNDYQREYGTATGAGRAGVRAGMAVPLLHEGRLLGALAIGTMRPEKRFLPEDAEVLELLAATAAAALVGLERAQLLAVTVAARELGHRLNNDLTLAVGTLDVLQSDETLPGEIRDMVAESAAGLRAAADHIRQFQSVVRFQTRETPVGPSLDLEGSVGPEGGAGSSESADE